MCDMKEVNVLLTLAELGAGYNVRLADLGVSYCRGDDSADYPCGMTGYYFDK